jgi:hypothetical protein
MLENHEDVQSNGWSGPGLSVSFSFSIASHSISDGVMLSIGAFKFNWFVIPLLLGIALLWYGESIILK